MKIIDTGSFFNDYKQKMFYVGFMKSGEAWFPACSVSDPQAGGKFDSLYVSLDYMVIHDLVQSLAREVKGIEGIFVHYLLREEVQNILDTYGLKHVVLTQDESGECGCGCGCGCGSDHAFLRDGGSAH